MSEDTDPTSSCTECGTPIHIGCEHNKSTNEQKKISEHLELNRETLARMNNLEVEVEINIESLIERLRSQTEIDLKPRPEGLHLTIIGPAEKGVLKTLDDVDINELQEINEQITSGEGITIDGIGIIDGSNSKFKLREADQVKKTSFVALSIPRFQAFREKLGLPPKDFHVTLGFEGGDIHSHVVGQEEIKPGKFKDIRELIPKKADPKFAEIFDEIPTMKFGGITGELKKEKKKVAVLEKSKKEKVVKNYDGDILRGLLTALVDGGNSGKITVDQIDKIVDLAITDPSSLGRELRADYRFVKPLLSQSER